MMQHIVKIDLRALSNDTHFSFHNAGIAVFTTVETENQLFKDYLKAWQDAYKRQDDIMYLLRKSMELEKANEQHAIRCNCLTGVMAGIRAHALCLHSPQYEVAKKAYTHLSRYRMHGNAGMDKISSSIHHLSDLLKEEEMQSMLTAIGLKDIFDKMNTANEAVIEAQALRDKVDNLKGTGGVQLARKETDEAYTLFVKCLESMMMLFPGTVEECVSTWNTTVMRYRKNLELKQALAAARRKAEEEGQTGQPPVSQEENKPSSGGNKPGNQPGSSNTEQNKPSTNPQPAPEDNKPTEENKPSEGKPNPSENQHQQPTDGDTSTEGTGSGPIYTPVNPAQEVDVK